MVQHIHYERVIDTDPICIALFRVKENIIPCGLNRESAGKKPEGGMVES